MDKLCFPIGVFYLQIEGSLGVNILGNQKIVHTEKIFPPTLIDIPKCDKVVKTWDPFNGPDKCVSRPEHVTGNNNNNINNDNYNNDNNNDANNKDNKYNNIDNNNNNNNNKNNDDNNDNNDNNKNFKWLEGCIKSQKLNICH